MAFTSSSFSRGFRTGERPLVITNVNQLPNLEVWYNASSGTSFNKTSSVANGTNITSWQNTGGTTSHDWNSTGGNRPVWYSNIKNSQGAVGFNLAGNTTQYFTINPVTYINSLSGATLIILYQMTSTASGIRYITSTDVGGFQFGQNGTTLIGGFSGATFTINSIPADTLWHHIIITFDGSKPDNSTRLKARLDGSDVALTITGTVNNATSGSAAYFFGGSTGTGANSASNFFIGYLGETMIFTRALTTNEILAIEQYLTNKWAV